MVLGRSSVQKQHVESKHFNIFLWIEDLFQSILVSFSLLMFFFFLKWTVFSAETTGDYTLRLSPIELQTSQSELAG